MPHSVHFTFSVTGARRLRENETCQQRGSEIAVIDWDVTPDRPVLHTRDTQDCICGLRETRSGLQEKSTARNILLDGY